jgi:crossover junction endodeoxyribonuclease RuvC
MAIILGIDPGSCITGYGVIRAIKHDISYISGGCIRVTANFIEQRLQQIFCGIREVIRQYQPEEIAIEQVFMCKNPNSALKLGQARGVAIVASSLEGLYVAEYSPRQIKQAVVGYGGATKVQVQQMIRTLLNLSGIPSKDAADALAVAMCHAHTRSGILPNTRRIFRRKRR